MRLTRAHNRLALSFIFSSCLLSLYGLFLKIRHIRAENEMDRNSEKTATITTISLTNRTHTGETNFLVLQLLIHSQDGLFPSDFNCTSTNGSDVLVEVIRTSSVGPSRLLLGSCPILPNSYQISIDNELSSVPIEVPTVAEFRKSVVCLSFAFLFEDVSSLLAILDHYYATNNLMVLYTDSMSDHVMQQIGSIYKKKLEIVPWQLISPSRSSRDPTARLFLESGSYSDTVSASFADCWLRFAPSTRHLTMLDMQSIKFNAHPGQLESRLSLLGSVEEDWELQKLTSSRIVGNEKKSVFLSSSCRSRIDDESCTPLLETVPVRQPPKKKTEHLRKPSSPVKPVYKYRQQLLRCSSHVPSPEGKPRHLKLEFDVGRSSRPDPCHLHLVQPDYKCRTAIQYAKRMFKDKLKVNVVQKRTLLRYSDGCHL